jgi:hypothetical protein
LIVAAAFLATACAGSFPSPSPGLPRPQAPRAEPKAPPKASSFDGAWCAQGDPRKPCSITSSGQSLSFTNEVGSKSSGHYVGIGQNRVLATQWGLVQGTLSQDGRRIDWSNGTYWARCQGGGGGGRQDANQIPNLDGRWYQSGDRSKACSIHQRDRNLSLTNEAGQNASGQIDGPDRITTTWSGKRITGRLSPGANTIYWDNGTTWAR